MLKTLCQFVSRIHLCMSMPWLVIEVLNATISLTAGCHITLFYYGGFSYLMLRRYVDAATAFNTILSYIAG